MGNLGKDMKVNWEWRGLASVPENIDAEVLSRFFIRSPWCAEKTELFVVQTAGESQNESDGRTEDVPDDAANPKRLYSGHVHVQVSTDGTSAI